VCVCTCVFKRVSLRQCFSRHRDFGCGWLGVFASPTIACVCVCPPCAFVTHQVCVVRGDVQMSTGKIAAQCCHGACRVRDKTT
jgi:hypothetical protein